jgi:hypothetical protein
VLELSVGSADDGSRPVVTGLLVTEPTVWLGRTTSGLIIGDHARSWLAVEGYPPRIRGVIAPPPLGGEGLPAALIRAAVLVALSYTGVYALHAAAVCIDDRALVLVGDSGAGKSTTATALTSVGCRYLGDDGVLLRERAHAVELLALSPAFRLTDEVLPSFGDLRPHLAPMEGKWSLDARSAFPGRYLAQWFGPITLLFLGRSAGKGTALSALPRAEATGLVIAQSGALGLECHPDPRRHLDLLALMVSRAQLARLDLGSEWLEDPQAAARRLIEQVRSLPTPSRNDRSGDT